jgi:Flp pilus assembly protein TadD
LSARTALPISESARSRSVKYAAAEKAIQLDPLLAALALADARHGQWKQAEENFRHEIQLDPNQVPGLVRPTRKET